MIQLSAETYTEGTVIDTLGLSITIRGVTDPSTGEPISILDGTNTHRVIQSISGETAETVFENLVIQRGYGPFFMPGPNRFWGSSPTVRNCTFQDNVGFLSGALTLQNGSTSRIVGTRFLNNTSSGRGALVITANPPNQSGGAPSAPTIEYCEFRGNSAAFGGAFYVNDSTPSIVRTLVTENTAATSGDTAGGFEIRSNSTVTLTHSVVCNNSEGSTVAQDTQYTIDGSSGLNTDGATCVSASCDDCAASLSQVGPASQ